MKILPPSCVRRSVPNSFLLFPFVALLGAVSAVSGAQGEVIFEDRFGPDSRGELTPNLVKEPPPVGLDFTTDVPAGFPLKKWIVADIEGDGPRRGFWVVPQRDDGSVDDFAEQAGRSRDSIAYARTPVPEDASHYVIEFRQMARDNDAIGFVIGASEPVLEHDGALIQYQRQLPGTDETTEDLYYDDSPWGTGMITDRSYMGEWVKHRIEVREGHVRWSQNGEVMLAGAVEDLNEGGYFGIRQQWDRGTRYDDVRIVVLERQQEPETEE